MQSILNKQNIDQKILITRLGPGLPRLATSETETVPSDKWENYYLEQEFFCDQGKHSLSLIFDTRTVGIIFPFWECEQCETVAFNTPEPALLLRSASDKVNS